MKKLIEVDIPASFRGDLHAYFLEETSPAEYSDRDLKWRLLDPAPEPVAWINPAIKVIFTDKYEAETYNKQCYGLIPVWDRPPVKEAMGSAVMLPREPNRLVLATAKEECWRKFGIDLTINDIADIYHELIAAAPADLREVVAHSQENGPIELYSGPQIAKQVLEIGALLFGADANKNDTLEDIIAKLHKERRSGTGFSYVDIVTPGCEGAINLFFGGSILMDSHCLALVRNPALASRIKDSIDAAPKPSEPVTMDAMLDGYQGLPRAAKNRLSIDDLVTLRQGINCSMRPKTPPTPIKGD